jgi:hypothetical protein
MSRISTQASHSDATPAFTPEDHVEALELLHCVVEGVRRYLDLDDSLTAQRMSRGIAAAMQRATDTYRAPD